MLHKTLYNHNIMARRMLFWGLFFLSVCMFLSSCTNAGTRINDVQISVNCDDFSYSNIQQDNTSIMMQAIDGSLYIYMAGDHKENSAVYRFDQNGASTLEDILVSYRHSTLWNDSVLGFSNGYMYIKRHPEKDSEISYPKKTELVCYDLTVGASETLVTTEKSSYMNCMFDQNGFFYVTTKEMSTGEETQYRRIENNVLLPDVIVEPNVRTGRVLEVLQAYNNVEPMLSESQLRNVAVSVTDLGIERHDCVLYPYEGGWLLHMSQSSIPLCLVLPDGTVSSVFTFECLTSLSSFNHYGDTAFFSLIRYEKWDDRMGYFLQRYENDSISGTYRIDLTDLTTTKISDEYYCGIFVFDDTGIFACDKKEGVYKLDFDGNLIATLIDPRSYP